MHATIDSPPARFAALSTADSRQSVDRVGGEGSRPPLSTSWDGAVGSRGLEHMPAALRTELDRFALELQLGEGKRARLFRPIRGPRRISLPERQPRDEATRVLLSRDGRTGYARALNQVSFEDLVHCHPMRDFARRNGQKNKPVAFYSRTVGDLVSCESQHERRFMVLADWHEGVVHIAAQPFTLQFPTGSTIKSHTPDFVLIGSSGAIVVVDVKWPSHALSETTIRRHKLVERTLAEAGMQHVVWTEAPAILDQNLANFAAARVPDRFMRELPAQLLGAYRPGMSVRGVLTAAAERHGVPASTGLVVLRRMLWDHQFTIDMTLPFTVDSQLGRS